MNPFYVAYARTYQFFLKLGIRMLRIPYPRILSSEEDLAAFLREKGLRRPLIVTDQGLCRLPSFLGFVETLSAAGFDCVVYDRAVPNPTFASIRGGQEAYFASSCDSIIAFGGGSPIDCAKGVGISIAYPKASLQRFKGVLHIHRRLPSLIAVPTTVGTGSEATLAAVVLNEETKDKFQIDSPRLVPQAALLETKFVLNLPPRLVATTGMDALTHALEAYLGKGGGKETDRLALSAIERILNHLLPLYRDPKSEEDARQMQLAAYEAGASFTRAFVGYVHALAHALGGAHGVPHGLANAILLVPTLRHYGSSIEKKLSALAPYFHVEGGDGASRAKAVLDAIDALREALGIPASFAGLVEDPDILALAGHAAKEGNPFYPVPKILTSEELADILEETLS